MTEHENGRQLFDREAEEATISAVMIDPESIRTIDLRPGDFYIVRNRWIWDAMHRLNDRHEEIDYLTVCKQIEADGKLEEMGGPAYVMSLVNKAPTSYHSAAYANIVRDMATRRRILEVANELARGAYDRSKPVDDVINRGMVAIPQLVNVKAGAEHIGYFASRHYDRLAEAKDDPIAKQKRILKTGMLDLDEATLGGLRLGELMLVLGKPGLGKTKWVHQMAAQLAGNGHAGVVFQCETSEEEIMDREFSRMTKIPTERLEVANLSENEWSVYVNAVDQMSADDNGLYMSFGSSWSTATIRAELTRLKAEHGIQFFAVDYLRFLTDKYGKDETERENYISIQLKMICRELDIAGIVIHSMNKGGISSPSPELEHAGGGAGISFDCDKALFMTEHIPSNGGAVYKDYRTFVFRKSRRKLKFTVFQMQAFRDYPFFGDVAREEKRSV